MILENTCFCIYICQYDVMCCFLYKAAMSTPLVVSELNGMQPTHTGVVMTGSYVICFSEYDSLKLFQRL